MTRPAASQLCQASTKWLSLMRQMEMPVMQTGVRVVLWMQSRRQCTQARSASARETTGLMEICENCARMMS